MTVPSYPGIAPPPTGVFPNIENPKDAGRTLLLTWLVVCNALVFFFFFTRTYAKVWITRKILLEDITCTTAWALFVLYSAATSIMIYHGEGYHAWEVKPQDYLEILKWLYIGSIIYCPVAYAIKVTLLLLIARVFSVRKSVSWAIHIFIIALFITYIPNQIAKTIICTPIRAFWDQSVKGKCLQQRKIFIADTTLAIVTDLVILILPVPLTWSLRSPMREKIKIMVLLGAGGVATAVSIYRLYNVIKFIESKDVTSDFVYQSITVLVELTIGLLCSCLPATNILLRRFNML
ncbi:hypothetical protein F5883DRAFT_654234 [Diaporthe sp. PMI_573]|nr:hypothetical protein F5883DRAFT_654234 [Diaporthaceae sp. PMI_573]